MSAIGRNFVTHTGQFGSHLLVVGLDPAVFEATPLPPMNAIRRRPGDACAQLFVATATVVPCARPTRIDLLEGVQMLIRVVLVMQSKATLHAHPCGQFGMV